MGSIADDVTKKLWFHTNKGLLCKPPCRYTRGYTLRISKKKNIGFVFVVKHLNQWTDLSKWHSASSFSAQIFSVFILKFSIQSKKPAEHQMICRSWWKSTSIHKIWFKKILVLLYLCQKSKKITWSLSTTLCDINSQLETL